MNFNTFPKFSCRTKRRLFRSVYSNITVNLKLPKYDSIFKTKVNEDVQSSSGQKQV